MKNEDKMVSLVELNDYTDADYRAYINSISDGELLSLRNRANVAYYNSGEHCLSDDRYDIIVDILVGDDMIGAIVAENRVILPYFMGSLNKIKTGQVSELKRWADKNVCDSYIVEDKIDGVSCLFFSNETSTFLYTRGNGLIGADISYLRKCIPNIPKKLRESITIRGELVMNRNVFEENFSHKFANPRNMVTGIIGTKGIHGQIGKVKFIAYEIIGEKISPEEQLLKLKALNFEVVKYDTLNFLEDGVLDLLLDQRRKDSPYDIDGLVIQPNKPYERNVSGNPSYAVAYKGLSKRAITTVIDVKWNVSKWGLLKPRVRVCPVNLGGVSISYATGFNAKYIYDNKIGEGAVIEITRSGDVIPHIVRVVKCANEAKMPSCEYEWNDTHVDIISVESGLEEKIKLITYFFSAMDIKFVGAKTVEKLVMEGFDTIEKILKATMDDLLKIKGFQVKTAERIFNNIREGMSRASLATILSASGVFGVGFGEKKILALMTAIPNLLQSDCDKCLETEIEEIEGFSKVSVTKIMDNLDKAREFIAKLGMRKEMMKEEERKNDECDLSHMSVVFSGFRDKEMSDTIVKRGGKVMSGVSAKTTHLVVKNDGLCSTKTIAAKDKSVAIHTVEEFRGLFSL